MLSAVAAAAIMHKKLILKIEKFVQLVSGGNIDVTMLSLIIEKGLVNLCRKDESNRNTMDKPGTFNVFNKCIYRVFSKLYKLIMIEIR